MTTVVIVSSSATSALRIGVCSVSDLLHNWTLGRESPNTHTILQSARRTSSAAEISLDLMLKLCSKGCDDTIIKRPDAQVRKARSESYAVDLQESARGLSLGTTVSVKTSPTVEAHVPQEYRCVVGITSRVDVWSLRSIIVGTGTESVRDHAQTYEIVLQVGLFSFE